MAEAALLAELNLALWHTDYIYRELFATLGNSLQPGQA